jgi:serine/threonine protein kinase
MDKIKKYEPLWGDWLIDEKIGEGSYGKVYRICRENNGNTYYAAVKIITIPQSISEISALASEGMDEDSISAYFRDVLDGLVEEIDLLYSFRGLSNIVNIDDYKVIKNDDNVTYDILIKMELLKDITSFVQSTPLTKAEVFKLALDMCKALEVCHKKNIIHRDIKPDNMFVSEHGDYKLGDFGVARKMEKTLSGLSKKGTYLYMAPEVFKGEDYNHTVDIYSLGIVIYRFLNGGKLPFFSSNQIMYRQREEALAKRLRGEPVPYPESGEGQFESIILKACSYNPKDRYQNIKELKEALSKVVMDSLESAMITTSPQKKVGEAKTDAIQTNKSQKEFKTDVANNDAQNNNVLTDLNPGTIGIDKMTKTQLIDDTSLRKNKSIFEEEISKLEQKTDFQLESDSLITQSKDSEVTYIDNKLKKGNVKNSNLSFDKAIMKNSKILKVFVIFAFIIIISIFGYSIISEKSNAIDDDVFQIKMNIKTEIYENTSLDSEVLGVVQKKDIFTVEERIFHVGKMWYKITTKNGISGYVQSEYIGSTNYSIEYLSGPSNIEDPNMFQIKVLSTQIPIYSSMDVGSVVVGEVINTEIFNVLNRAFDGDKLWYNIETSSGINGYIYNDKYSNSLKEIGNRPNQSVNLSDSNFQVLINRNAKHIFENNNSESSILGTVYLNEIFNVIERNFIGTETWYKIQTETGIIGYLLLEQSDDSINEINDPRKNSYLEFDDLVFKESLVRSLS